MSYLAKLKNVQVVVFTETHISLEVEMKKYNHRLDKIGWKIACYALARQSLKTTITSANQGGVLILVRRHISVHHIIGMKMRGFGWTSVVLNLRHSKLWIGGCYLAHKRSAMRP